MDDPNKRRKVTVYLSPALLREIRDAAQAHDRSASWIVRRAWQLAKSEIGRLPARRRAPDDGAGNAA